MNNGLSHRSTTGMGVAAVGDMTGITHTNAVFTLWLHCLQNSLFVSAARQRQYGELLTLFLIYIILLSLLIRLKHM
jgi:hypothetical protein